MDNSVQVTRKFLLGVVLFLCLLAALFHRVRTSQPDQLKADEAMTPQQRQAAEDAAMPQAVKVAEVGVTTRMIDHGNLWPCAASKRDLFDLMELDYAERQAIENHSDDYSLVKDKVDHFVSALKRTKSIVVPPSAQVTVLEKTSDARRVSIVRPPGYLSLDYEYAAARSCWVTVYAVVRK